mgnify:CR=1 FL=1
MRKVKQLKRWMRKLVKAVAVVEANTTCAFMNFQPQETKEIQKLRRF